MKKLASIVCASILLGATSVAFAGSRGESIQPEEGPTPVPAPIVEEEEAPTGFWYVGAAAVYGFENFNCDADDAWGYNIRAGRRINDMFAVEAQWEHMADDFDDVDIVDGEIDPSGKSNLFGDVEVWNVTANARFYPITGMFQPYLLVGGGYGQADLDADENHGFVARFGLGMDFLINDNFGIELGADYVLGTGQMRAESNNLGDPENRYDYIPVHLGVFYNFI